MRFINFQQIGVSNLPANFREHYESVWVNMSPELYDPKVAHDGLNSAINSLLAASKVGFDGVGVNEHHNNAYAMTPSAGIMAAMLARETTDVAVCVLGSSLPLYNPAIRVAEEMGMLDVISNGRLVAGFPLGTAMDGPYSYSINPSEVRARYLEANALIRKAWSTREVFEWNGRFNKLRYVNPWPRPMQRPFPPVWVPGGGSPETWDFTCENDYAYAYLSSGSYYKMGEVTDGYWERVKAHGLEPNPFRAAVAILVCVADSMDDAKDLYGHGIDYFFNRSSNIHPKFTSAPGYLSEGTIRKMMASKFARSRSHNFDRYGLSFEQLVEGGHIIAGSPEQVTETINKLGRSNNVGNFVTVTRHGDMSAEIADHNTALFASKVLPELQPVFEDEWEHNWWPQFASRPGRSLDERAEARA